MPFIEFKSVFIESEAPEVKSACRLEAVDHIEINTAGDDTENTGDYFVWLTLRGGEKIPCFGGTLEACKICYEKILSLLDKPHTIRETTCRTQK